MMLDPSDPEWDDDMTYLYVDYATYKAHLFWVGSAAFMFLYNYNMFFHNKNYQFVTKAILGLSFIQT